MLTEIHRQAGESAIIRLATMARQGQPIPYGAHDAFVWKMRAQRRRARADAARRPGDLRAQRHPPHPQRRHEAGRRASGAIHPEGRGEKIICLKNRHDLGLVNGMFLELSDIAGRERALLQRRRPRPRTATTVAGPAAVLQGPLRRPRAASIPTATGATWQSSAGLIESVWGYAITCHKAQGSQWENVIVLRRRLRPHRRGPRPLALHRDHPRRAGAGDPAERRRHRPQRRGARSGPSARATTSTRSSPGCATPRRPGCRGSSRTAGASATNGGSPTSTATRRASSGSCVIALRGEHAGDWIDFDGNQGGGPISAIEQATGLTGHELIAYAAEIAGVAPGAPPRQVPALAAGATARPGAGDRPHPGARRAGRRHAGRALPRRPRPGRSRTAPTCCSTRT